VEDRLIAQSNLRVVILYEKSGRPRIGIAGTGPAMTADRVAQVTFTATRPF
jgi:hypothetical protein